ncbi:hypothetical protein CAPTEDRAFT_199765 [Capitella teleta]|uniref:UPAR/Ly6 domain-containing protein n=1 Tax=Capitella teleta TaxID=283909 RepID=R7TTJ1_CAPTE|nr:hypothetical protein CAPTEDRAFT_199765 [Capitella teleta]|eukprot:ELT96994.1 hypothetical protein CAPTEDRAFT_199765 [Capitella teleta]
MLCTLGITSINYLRPGESLMCSVCSTDADGMSCYSNPPPPRECPMALSCANLMKSDKGRLNGFMRTCLMVMQNDRCFFIGRERVCITACSKDGCNSNSYQQHHLLDLLRKRK